MITLRGRTKPSEISSYSLTGDLLSFERCPLQYRVYTRTGIRESHPVQRWYGQFLHRGMRLAYAEYRDGADPKSFFFEEEEFRTLVDEVVSSLRAEGLHRPSNLGEPAERRLLRSIRLLGPLLFPIIAEAEVRVNAMRRSERVLYQVTGVVDVLANTRLKDQSSPFKVLVDAAGIPEDQDVELVVDYKGIAKAEIPSLDTVEKQVLTYAWLRQRQPGSLPVAAGILVFVNDLLDADADPDVDPPARELFDLLSRAMHVVPVQAKALTESLAYFDSTVEEIETLTESESPHDLAAAWEPRPDDATCRACDYRYECPQSAVDEEKSKKRPFAPAAP